MAVTDPLHNPSGKDSIQAIKGNAAQQAELIKAECPDNHVRQLALDHLRIATMLAVQSHFESDD